MNRFTKSKTALLGKVQGMATQHPTPAQQHDFKGLKDWIEVFYSGTHTDASGRTCSFTNADLDQMVSNNTKLGAAPFVIGHPKHDDPAMGWVGEAKREGDRLFIKGRDVNPAFEAGVKSGAYRNRSLRVAKTPDHGWRIQHVGWLGAALPALEGMQPLNYTANDADEVFDFAGEFATASALEDLASLLRGLRENLIAKEGIAAADAALPEWRISGVTASAERIRQAALDDEDDAPSVTPLFNQPTNPGASSMSFTQADLDRTAAETEARVRAEAALQFTQQAADLAQLQAERQAERIRSQIEGWKAGGKLLPAEEAGLAEFMTALESGQANEFSFTAAGATAATAKTPAQFFADFMAARGQLVRLGGQGATPQSAPVVIDQADYRAIADAANEFIAAEAKAGRTVDITAAVSHVTRKA